MRFLLFVFLVCITFLYSAMPNFRHYLNPLSAYSRFIFVTGNQRNK